MSRVRRYGFEVEDVLNHEDRLNDLEEKIDRLPDTLGEFLGEVVHDSVKRNLGSKLDELERRIDGCALANVVFRELAGLGRRVSELESGEAEETVSREVLDKYPEQEASRPVADVLRELIAKVGIDQVWGCLKAVVGADQVWHCGWCGKSGLERVQLVEPLAAVRRTLRLVREIEGLEPGAPFFDLGGPYRVGRSDDGEYRLRRGGNLRAKSRSPAGIVLAWVRETERAP